MEDLNKTQIILLALLVSFVGSVATSIMTYSLLSEAPPAITQTVNRVVERTVETVVPTQIKPDVVTREVTVVVQEEDLVIDAISKNKNSLVRIWNVDGETKTLMSLGVLISDSIVVTGKIEQPASGSLEAVFSDGSVVSLESPINKDYASYFKVTLPVDSALVPSVLANSDSLQLGQSVIALRGIEKISVSIGRIIGLDPLEQIEFSKFSLIETDASQSNLGSPLVNLQGEVAGIRNSSTASEFIPINLIGEEVKSL